MRTDEEMIAFLETGEVDEIVASNAFIEPWKVRLRTPHLPISPHVSPCLPISDDISPYLPHISPTEGHAAPPLH